MTLQRRSSLFVGAVWTLFLLGGIGVRAQITNTANSNATQLATNISGAGVTVTNATLTCSNKATSTFTAVATAIGLTDGIALCTGDVTKPNVTSGLNNGTSLGTAGYAPLDGIAGAGTNDACRLEFDVVPTTKTIQFKYVFGSDEYPDYVGSSFNDAFGFFISGPGITGTKNIGVLPGTTTAITINTVNTGTNAQYFTNYNKGTATGYNGVTKVLTATADVIPCKTYHLILAIADGSDAYYDSNVWIEKNSLVSVGPSQAPPAVSGNLGNGRIYENCDSATFTFTLPSAALNDYGFKIAIKGTAVNGVDYRTITDTLTILKGQTSVSINILPLNDAIVDGGETVTLCILEACTNKELYCQTLTIEELTSTITPETTICVTDSAQLAATNNANYKYKWTPNTGMNCDTCYNPKVSPPDTTEYTVTVSDKTCFITKKVKINIIRSDAGLDDTLTVCENGPNVDLFTKTNGDAPSGGHWISPTGAAFTNPYKPPVHSPGVYLYAVSENNCPEDTSAMLVKETLLPNAGVDGKDTACNNSTTVNLFDFITNEPAGGTWSGPGSVNGSTGIANVTSLTPKAYNYLYIVKGTAPCGNDTAIATVIVKALPTANFPAVAPFCKGTTGYLKPVFTGVAPYSITFMDCAGNSTTVNGLLNGDSIPINPTSSPCTYTITSVSDGGDYSCTNTAQSTRQVTLLTPPTIQLDSLICNATNTGYNAYLTLNGGDSPSYKINGASTGITGSKFKSAVLAGGSTYNFTLTDKNGCLPQSAITGFKNCDCTTDAGTMKSNTVEVCGSTPAVATHNNDHKLDGNDVKNYILHDNPGVLLGTVYAINKTAPSFTYDPAWGIQYDQTYYISAIVGDKQSGDATATDTNNLNGCLSVAIGQPVIFHETPSASAALDTNRICLGDSTFIIFTMTAGKEPYSYDYSYNNGPTTSFTGVTTANNTKYVTPTLLGANTYVITQVTDKFNCSAAMATMLDLTTVDRPVTNNLNIVCNSINTAYTVSFNIVNGDPASYTVNGVSTGGATSYTSAPINSGDPYDFHVADMYMCKEAIISGSNTCPCITDAGTMTVPTNATPLEFCINATAIVTHSGDQVFDGNDTLSFVICTNPNDPVISRLNTNLSTTPSFIFDPTKMTAGTTYYICPVAGDKDANGLVDLGSNCQDNSPGTPVKFIALPTVSMTGSKEICQGDSATITFTITGNGNVRFTMLGSDGTTQALNFPPGIRTTKVGPSIASGSITYTVDPATIYDSTSPTNCAGNYLPPDVVITVHPTPTAMISGNPVICYGESPELTIVTTGDNTLTTRFGRVGVTADTTFIDLAGTYQQAITPNLPPGIHTFQIRSIKDNTIAGCPGIGSGTATVEVRPTPNAGISLEEDEICFGDSTKLLFTSSGYGMFTIYFHDNQAHTFIKTKIVSDTFFYVSPPSNIRYTLDKVEDGSISSVSSKPCSKTFSDPVNLTVHQLPIGELSGNKEICFGETAEIYFQTNGSYNLTAVYDIWNNETGARKLDSLITSERLDSVLVQPADTTTYTLVKLYDTYGCVATDYKGSAYIPVNPIPVPIVAASDTASCPPLVTTLLNLTDSRYLGDYTWHFGNGTSMNGNGADPGQPQTYDEPGSYDIRLEVTSPQGCYKDTVLENFLTVHPFPIAAFDWQPRPNTVIDPYVNFINLSEGDAQSHWTYYTSSGGILDSSDLREPSYAFPDQDTGSYPVKLLVATEFGCLDSTVRVVKIEGVFEVYAPNTFTPNNDDVNDTFRPVLIGEKHEGYELSIFNRWGERLFHTTNEKEGWNGSYQGEIVKEDVYIFQLKVRSRYNAEKKSFTGQVRVLK